MVKARAKNDQRAKRNKQKAARRAQQETRALESLGLKRQPFEGLLREIVAAVLQTEGPSPALGGVLRDTRWIEVGAGLGQLRSLLPSQVLGYITHTELSESLVRGLRSKHPGALAIPADVTALPFEAGSVDAVLGLCVFDSFPAPAHSASEIGRVLRPGGRFIHFLDAATNIEPILTDAVTAGLLPLPNFFADIALRRPDLVEPMGVEHLVAPYHDVLTVPIAQFGAVTSMLRKSGHRLAAMFERYTDVFLNKPFDALSAARAFVRLTSDPTTGRPVNQALMSLYTTLRQPPYREHVPFELRSLSSLQYFQRTLEHHFKPSLGFQQRLSHVVYARRYEPNVDEPLRARVRRVGIGQNSVHWPVPEGVAASQLQRQRAPAKGAVGTPAMADGTQVMPAIAGGSVDGAPVKPETHILWEAAIYCFVAEKDPAGSGD